MNLSVIIITAHRLETLRRCLDALETELADGDEVIVVSASSPVTEHVVEEEYKGVRVVESDRMGMPYQRNIGMRYVKNDIVAFVDDDAFVQEQWRSELMRCYEDPTVSSVVGKEILKGYEHIRNGVQPGVKWYGRVVGVTFFDAEDICRVESGQGCNMSFRKEALEAIGLFDPNYIVKAYAEESDVFERLKRAGRKVIYNPGAVVSHEPASAVEYGRSAFDKRGVFYMNRNYAYFFTKFYLLRPPFVLHLALDSIRFGWKCLLRVLVNLAHSVFVFFVSLAGKATGVWEGLKWHARRGDDRVARHREQD